MGRIAKACLAVQRLFQAFLRAKMPPKIAFCTNTESEQYLPMVPLNYGQATTNTALTWGIRAVTHCRGVWWGIFLGEDRITVARIS